MTEVTVILSLIAIWVIYVFAPEIKEKAESAITKITDVFKPK